MLFLEIMSSPSASLNFNDWEHVVSIKLGTLYFSCKLNIFYNKNSINFHFTGFPNTQETCERVRIDNSRKKALTFQGKHQISKTANIRSKSGILSPSHQNEEGTQFNQVNIKIEEHQTFTDLAINNIATQ